MSKIWYVYIISNKKNGTLYIGVTSDLLKRIRQHKNKSYTWFSAKYGLDMLVYYEDCGDMESAITREKELKWRLRKKKINLIESINPAREDLYEKLER